MTQNSHILVILDASGSMQPKRGDTIGGVNAYLAEQARADGAALVTVVTFNDTMTTIRALEAVTHVRPITEADYSPSGNTALYDAVGLATSTLRDVDRGWAQKTVVLIFTDGQENASKTWTRALIREQITALQARGWEFLYFGADLSSMRDAQAIGVPPGNMVRYAEAETSLALSVASAMTRNVREGKHAAAGVCVPTSWGDAISGGTL